jgi:hypothetical protein
VWIRSARWLAARRVHLLQLLCFGRAHTPVLLLLPHAVGELWPSAPPSVTAPFTLVAIFIHFCEMYVVMWLSVCLFWIFHMLLLLAQKQGSGRVHHRPLPDKWDRWRDDWVIMHANAHDRLELLTAALMGSRNGWEKVPDMQQAYSPMVKRIQFLAENGLTSMMVLFKFLSRRIAPLQQRAHPTWLYTEENGTTQLEQGHRLDLDSKVLDSMLSKLSTDPSSSDFINPHHLVCQFSWTSRRGHNC